MNCSQTTTLPLRAMYPLGSVHLTSPTDIQRQFESFLDQVRDSKQFDEEKKQEWEEQFRTADFNAEEQKNINALLLGLFLWQVIRPALLSTNKTAQRQAFQFELSLRTILRQLLPSEVEIDGKIAEYGKYLREFEKNFSAGELERMGILFKEIERDSSRQASEFTEETRAYFVNSKEALLALNEQQIEASKIEEEFDPLMNGLKDVVLSIVSTTEEAEKLQDRVKAYDADTERLRAECPEIIKKGS